VPAGIILQGMKIVTSGAGYIDIDAYAGCIAYAELLRLKGHDAKAICEAPWNESISSSVRAWKVPFETVYTPANDDSFIIIDVSDPGHFEKFADLERVVEVIDHHPGFEQYWQERIGEKAQIEFIGAACTQVYEQWKAAGAIDSISVVSARLLIAGILDNTLNFGAEITTTRDRIAYDDLLKIAELPNDWTAQYFTECQHAILADVSEALANDTKTLTFASLPGTVGVGQLVLWDTEEVLLEHRADIEEILAKVASGWFLNLVNVGQRKSYFVCEDAKIQAWLSQLLGVRFTGSIAEAERLWLRKEIIMQDRVFINTHS
jgi:inorganic pyrophosphatase